MLQDDFVPVAIDQWYTRNQRDPEGEFYQKIASQGPRTDLSATTQGCYIASATGDLVAYNNNFGPDRIRGMMKSAIARKRDWSAEPIKDFIPDERFSRDVPDGAMVIGVRSRVTAGYPKPRSNQHLIKQQSIGRDNLWIMPAESKSLANNEFPQSLSKKIARFHLFDNTRGEPPMWSESDIKQLEIQLDGKGRLSGRVELETESGDRSYQVDLFGHVEVADGMLKRFDVVAKGMHRGEGKWNGGAPAEQYPLVVAFRISTTDDISISVRPQALKSYGQGYLDFGRE